jgi:hypothetical protein
MQAEPLVELVAHEPVNSTESMSADVPPSAKLSGL